MKVSGEKLKAARIAAGKNGEPLPIAVISLVSKLGERRLFQIEANGGNVNDNIVEAIARKLKVKADDLRAG